MRPQIVTILTLILSTMSSMFALAQDGGGPPPPITHPPEIPIDSSIAILIVAALVYGGYIAFKKMKQIPTNS